MIMPFTVINSSLKYILTTENTKGFTKSTKRHNKDSVKVIMVTKLPYSFVYFNP